MQLNSRGQIFSMDFLFSVAIMLLVLGFLLMFLDVSFAVQRDEAKWLSLKKTGDRASNLLVSSPDLTCVLVDSAGNELMPLTNCVVASNISKQELGISSEFGCLLEIGGSTVSDCRDSVPADAENVYVVKRFVVTGSETMEKTNIPSNHNEAILKLWRIYP